MEIGAQIITVVVAVGAAGVFATRGGRVVDAWMRRVGRRGMVCGVLIAGLSFAFNCEIARRNGMPQPRIQDEFSYLLAADTFSHGRLTNPTHPLWRFFETFHVLSRPSYMSKYPPGQGLMLAAGAKLADEPIVGAWIGAAILCAAAFWMLRGFFSPTWSLSGAILLAVHPAIAQWSQTFWGGTVAAIGGVVVLGAWVRLKAKPNWKDGALGGIGLVVLAISRPFEGAAFAAPILISLLIRPKAALLAMAAVAAAGAVWMGYYNYRITNHFWELPYFAYERQYAIAPPFLWESLRPQTSFDRPEMREYAEQIEVPHFLNQRTAAGFLEAVKEKTGRLIGEVASPWLIGVPLLACAAAMRSERRLRIPLIAAAMVLGATLMSNWTRLQYVAPAAGAVLIAVVAGLRWIDRRAPAVVRGLIVGIGVGAVMLSMQRTRPGNERFQRAELAAELNQMDGKNLVIVRYLPGHRLDDEWVYNDADIDGSKTVWAHDMGDAQDESLLSYFKDRQAWRLDVDSESARIQRLVPPSGPPGKQSGGG